MRIRFKFDFDGVKEMGRGLLLIFTGRMARRVRGMVDGSAKYPPSAEPDPER